MCRQGQCVNQRYMIANRRIFQCGLRTCIMHGGNNWRDWRLRTAAQLACDLAHLPFSACPVVAACCTHLPLRSTLLCLSPFPYIESARTEPRKLPAQPAPSQWRLQSTSASQSMSSASWLALSACRRVWLACDTRVFLGNLQPSTRPHVLPLHHLVSPYSGLCSPWPSSRAGT